MTRSDEPPEELTAIEREALARVQRLGSGQATRRDIEETKRWGNQSSAHSEALAQASLLWDQLGPAGANLLNLTGTAHHEEVFALAAQYDAAIVLCFVQGDNVVFNAACWSIRAV